MKTIIAGSRDVCSIESILRAVKWAQEEGFNITEVVSGTCRGADKLGEEYAKSKGIPIKRMPAN